jgi:hypothetical protein
MNYTDFFSNIFGYALETFAPMQPYFWPLFFGGIIGYIYCAMNSLIAAVVGILLVFGVFAGTAVSGFFAEVPVFSQFLYIITIVGFTLLVGTLIMKRRF